MELLTACANVHSAEASSERVRSILLGGVDWERTVELASWHRLFPILHWQLKDFPPDLVPAEVRRELAIYFLQNASRALEMSAQLLRLLEALKVAGVPAVPYKGPALAAHVYGNVAFRYSDDLDIVIRPADYERAQAVLLALGYEPLERLTSSQHAYMLKNSYHEGYRLADGVPVELHWGFTTPDVRFPIALERVLGRLGRTALGGEQVPIFMPEEHLLILCVHGAKHRWSRVEWLLSAAALIRKSPALDWDRVIRIAGECRSRRILLLGVTLAHRLFDAPVPPPILDAAAGDRGVSKLADELLADLCNGVMLVNDEHTGSLGRDLFHFRIRETAVDRVRMLVHRFVTPSRRAEWVTVGWGGRAVGLHQVVRPFRVTAKLVRAAGWYLWGRRGTRR